MVPNGSRSLYCNILLLQFQQPYLVIGSLYFFAVPYVAWTFAIALLTMPRLWTGPRNKGYVTAADFVKADLIVEH